MSREIMCEVCSGTGKIKVDACAECNTESAFLGEYEGKIICQECWGAKLTAEDIAAL